MSTEQHLTTQQVAERMAVHPRTVRKWMNEGRLAFVNVGRVVRIPESALAKLGKPNAKA